MSADRPNLLIDGTNVLMRHYKALEFNKRPLELETIHNLSISMIKGWIDYVARPESATIVVFDGIRGKEKRLAIYPEYKAGRSPKDPVVEDSINALHMTLIDKGFRVYREHHYEADDVIATLAARLTKLGRHSIVFSTDKDLHQILSPTVTVQATGRKEWNSGPLTVEAFYAKWGFPPHLYADFKALAGDPSDAIPGLEGVGEVIARKMIAQFGSIEEIYAEQWQWPTKYRPLFIDKQDEALKWRSITALDLNVPIP